MCVHTEKPIKKPSTVRPFVPRTSSRERERKDGEGSTITYDGMLLPSFLQSSPRPSFGAKPSVILPERPRERATAWLLDNVERRGEGERKEGQTMKKLIKRLSMQSARPP